MAACFSSFATRSSRSATRAAKSRTTDALLELDSSERSERELEEDSDPDRDDSELEPEEEPEEEPLLELDFLLEEPEDDDSSSSSSSEELDLLEDEREEEDSLEMDLDTLLSSEESWLSSLSIFSASSLMLFSTEFILTSRTLVRPATLSSDKGAPLELSSLREDSDADREDSEPEEREVDSERDEDSERLLLEDREDSSESESSS